MDVICNKLNICRACLVENNSQLLCWTAPVETVNESITYLECFQMCTRLMATVDDQLPQSICFQCAAELRDAYEFIKKANQSHQTLLIKQEPLFVKTDEDGQTVAASFEWVAVQKPAYDENFTTDTIADTIVKTSPFELPTSVAELTINVNTNIVKDYDSESLHNLDGSSTSLDKDESDNNCKIGEKSMMHVKGDKFDCSSTSMEKNDSDSSYTPDEEPMRRVKSIKKKSQKQPKSNKLKSKSIEREILLCHLCPRTFKAIKSLKDHALTHEGNRERNYTCELCGKAFLSKGACKKHYKTHDVNRLKPFKCQQCDKSFLHHCSLKKHMLSHSGDTLECKICKKVLLTQTSYQNHYKKHDVNRKAMFQCKQCEKSFYYKRSLDQHMPIHTNGLFRCGQCDKSFFHKYSLDVHLLMHTGETVPCEVCGKRFARSCDLKGHMRTHSKDTPFKCQYCDKAFSRIGVLNKHELGHEGFRYACKICGKEYTNQASLFKHKLTHTGITMKCLICGKGFNEKFKMKRHIAGVHKIEMDKTEDLIQKVKTKREYRGLIIDET